MQKWEYLEIVLDRGYDSIISGGATTPWSPSMDIKSLGLQGWELVAVVPISSFHTEFNNGFTSTLYFYYKRPIE